MRRVTRLGEVCDLVMGQAPEGTNYNNSGRGWPLLAGAGDFKDGRPAPKKFTTQAPKRSQPGDVVLGIRATIGEKVWADGIYCLGRGVVALRPRGDLDRGFLWHWLTYVEHRLRARAKGATFVQVNRDDIADLEMVLPPLAEQRRIAEVLDRAEALRAKRREALALVDAVLGSCFSELFGDPQPDSRWPLRTLGELCFVRGGKRLPKGEPYSPVPTAHRYIRLTDISAGVVNEDGLVYLTPDVQQKIARYTVEPGDLIISIAGTIGVVAPVTTSLAGANLTENAAKLVARDRHAYDSPFLACMLRTPYLQAQIGAHTGQVTIGKLALFRIEQLRVPLPPLSLQQEFARRAAAVDRLKSLHRAHLAELDALFASLQHRAFRGEL